MLLACGLAMLAVLTGPAESAWAQPELVDASPSSGSILDAAPETLELRFDEAVELPLGEVALLDGFGDAVSTPAAHRSHDDDRLVELQLPPLAPGSYVVAYRVTGLDGSVSTGVVSFQVGPSSTLLATTLDGASAGPPPDTSARWAVVVFRAISWIATVLLLGGLLAIARGGHTPDGLRRWLRIAGPVAVATGLLVIPLHAGYVTGEGLGALVDPGAWSASWSTHLGTWWAIRSLLLAALAVIALRPPASPSTARLLAGVGIVSTALASAVAGHAAVARWPEVSVAVAVAHSVSLIVLCGVLLSREQPTVGSTPAWTAPPAWLVVSGVASGALTVSGPAALLDSPYGRTLLVKAGLVGVLGFVAVGASRRDAARSVSRALGVTLVVVVAVVGVSALLALTDPQRTDPPEPFSTTLIADGYLASLAIDPGQVGPNQFHLYFSAPGGGLQKPTTVDVTMEQPDLGLAPLDLPVAAVGANHFQTLSTQIPAGGTWVITVVATYDDGGVHTFRSDVPIAG
ncbi:MAG: copper resistance protein CopC [Ilumatobacteraceae bacterium]